METIRRRGLICLLVITLACIWVYGAISGTEAQAKSDEAALNAMRSMAFLVKQGDRATILFRSTTKRPTGDEIFELAYKYKVIEALGKGLSDPNGAYIVEVNVASSGSPGKTNPPGYDDAIQKLFPAVQLRMNRAFQPVAVINWPDVERQQKEGLKNTTGLDPALKSLLMPMLFNFLSQDVLLDFMKPITIMQNYDRKDVAGVFRLSFEKNQGENRVPGERTIVPVSQTESEVLVNFDTQYNANQITETLKKSALGSLLGPEFAMTMKSTGKAAFDRQNGWIKSIREEITVTSSGTTTETPPRIDILEIEQIRQ